MSATRKTRPAQTSFEKFKLWSAALFSGILTLGGCGVEAPSNAPESDAAPVQSQTGETVDTNVPDSMSSESPDNLLRSAPGQWLQTQVQTAAQLRRDGRYSEELAVWDETIASLNNQVGAGYWVTAGARLSHDVSKQLAGMNAEQLQKWKQFQVLEKEVVDARPKLDAKFAKGEIDQVQFNVELQKMIDKCDQQRAIIEELFGHQNHLLGNISFARAEMLANQLKFVPALVEAERSLRLRESSIKVQHPDTLASLKLMGRLSKNAGRLDLAKDCFARAVRQAEHVWGPQHLSYADHVNDLGVFYYWALENKKDLDLTYADASHWLNLAMRIRRNRLGEDALLTGMSLRNYALLKLGQGTSKREEYRALDYADAEATMEQAVPIFRAKASDKAMLAQVLIESATAKMLVNEYATAEARLREVRNGELAQFNPDAISLSLAELDYRIAAACLHQKGDTAKVAEGKAMMERLINSQSSDRSAMAIAARAARKLEKLNESKKFSPLPPTTPEAPTRISALPETNLFK